MNSKPDSMYWVKYKGKSPKRVEEKKEGAVGLSDPNRCGPLREQATVFVLLRFSLQIRLLIDLSRINNQFSRISFVLWKEQDSLC